MHTIKDGILTFIAPHCPLIIVGFKSWTGQHTIKPSKRGLCIGWELVSS